MVGVLPVVAVVGVMGVVAGVGLTLFLLRARGWYISSRSDLKASARSITATRQSFARRGRMSRKGLAQAGADTRPPASSGGGPSAAAAAGRPQARSSATRASTSASLCAADKLMRSLQSQR